MSQYSGSAARPRAMNNSYRIPSEDDAMNTLPDAHKALAQQFLNNADAEYRHARLSTTTGARIAVDAGLLALAAHVSPEQPIPHVFFAAVHFLLLQGYAHPLAQFYSKPHLDAASAATSLCRLAGFLPRARRRHAATTRHAPQPDQRGRPLLLLDARLYLHLQAGRWAAAGAGRNRRQRRAQLDVGSLWLRLRRGWEVRRSRVARAVDLRAARLAPPAAARAHATHSE